MSKVLSFRVDTATYTQLHKAAAEAGYSPSQMARVYFEAGMGGDVQTAAVAQTAAAVQRQLVHAVRRLMPQIHEALLGELEQVNGLPVPSGEYEAQVTGYEDPDEQPVTPRPRGRGKRRGKRGGRR